jgi:hypothetical protein
MQTMKGTNVERILPIKYQNERCSCNLNPLPNNIWTLVVKLFTFHRL